MSSNGEPNVLNVQPVYQAIDGHEFRQALRLLHQLQQKYPNSRLLVALRALALERTGNRPEALQLCQQLCAFKWTTSSTSSSNAALPPPPPPTSSSSQQVAASMAVSTSADITDETILNPLALVLKNALQWSKIEALYDRAFQLCPANEELGTLLFYAHSRKLNFLKQQQLASKLYRQFKNNQYLIWSIASIVMQLRGDPTSASSSTLRVLALKMFEKYIADGNLKSAETARLYVQFLESQNLLDLAISAVTDATVGDLLDQLPYDRLTILAKFYEKKRESHSDAHANTLYTHLLRDHNTDEWSWWLGFVETSLRLQIAPPPPDQFANEIEFPIGSKRIKASCSWTLDQAVQFTHLMQEKSGHELRGPYLAEIELQFRSSHFDQVQRLLVSYFEKFGAKSVCYGDMNLYISAIPADKLQVFIEELAARSPNSSVDDDKKRRITNMLYEITRNQLLMRLGLHKQDNMKFAREMLSRYFEALSFGTDLKDSERQYGDPFLLLCVHSLIHQYRLDTSISSPPKNIDVRYRYLIEAICLLEFGLSKSVHNFQFKILLIHIYSLLGSVSTSCDIFSSLSIKHIQWETCSYLILYDLLRVGPLESAQSIVNSVLTFHVEHLRETPELMLHAYRCGTFSKLEEFVDFKDRLDRSLLGALCDAECTLLALPSIQGQSTSEILKFLERDIAFRRSFRQDAPDPPEGPVSVVPHLLDGGLVRMNDDYAILETYLPEADRAQLSFLPAECSTSMEHRVRAVNRRRLIPHLVLCSISIAQFDAAVIAQQRESEKLLQQQLKKAQKKAQKKGKGAAATTSHEEDSTAQANLGLQQHAQTIQTAFRTCLADFRSLVGAESDCTIPMAYERDLWAMTEHAFMISFECACCVSSKYDVTSSSSSSQEHLSKIESLVSEFVALLKKCVESVFRVLFKPDSPAFEYSPEKLPPLKALYEHLAWLTILLPVWASIAPAPKAHFKSRSGPDQPESSDLRDLLSRAKSIVLEALVKTQSQVMRAVLPGKSMETPFFSALTNDSLLSHHANEAQKFHELAHTKLNGGISAVLMSLDKLFGALITSVKTIKMN